MVWLPEREAGICFPEYGSVLRLEGGRDADFQPLPIPCLPRDAQAVFLGLRLFVPEPPAALEVLATAGPSLFTDGPHGAQSGDVVDVVGVGTFGVEAAGEAELVLPQSASGASAILLHPRLIVRGYLGFHGGGDRVWRRLDGPAQNPQYLQDGATHLVGAHQGWSQLECVLPAPVQYRRSNPGGLACSWRVLLRGWL